MIPRHATEANPRKAIPASRSSAVVPTLEYGAAVGVRG